MPPLSGCEAVLHTARWDGSCPYGHERWSCPYGHERVQSSHYGIYALPCSAFTADMHALGTTSARLANHSSPLMAEPRLSKGAEKDGAKPAPEKNILCLLRTLHENKAKLTYNKNNLLPYFGIPLLTLRSKALLLASLKQTTPTGQHGRRTALNDHSCLLQPHGLPGPAA